MIICTECDAVLANRNNNVKYLTCAFCLFGNSDFLSRREILFPETENALL